MHARSHVRRVLSLLLLVVLLAGSAFLFGPMSYAASHVVRSNANAYSAARGVVTRVGTVNPRLLPTGKVPQASPPTRVIPYHGVPKLQKQTGKSPTAVGVPLQRGTSGLLLHNFDALKSLDDQNLLGYQLEPPDQGLCVGNGYVVEVINTVGAVYRPDGLAAVGPFNLQNFFQEAPGINGTFISDPRCYYDAVTRTWFATILALPPPPPISPPPPPTTRVDIAVNSSGDPTTPWTVYRLDTTDTGHVGCPCQPDYPILGIDAFNIYITTTEFPLFSVGLNGAQIYAIDKMPLESPKGTVRFVQFSNLSTGGFPTFHLQPTITNGSAAAEYLMNSVPFDSLDNRLGLWAITNQQAVGKGGIPTLSTTTLTSETYITPSSAPNPNGNFLSPDDDSLQSLQYSNGTLWASLNTALFVSGDPVSRDGAAWFAVHPSISGGNVSGNIFEQGYVASQGQYVIYPAIASSPDGNTVMVFTVTGRNTLPSAAYAVLSSSASSFGPVTVAAPGATTDNGFSCGGLLFACRWGDYSAAVVDPGSTNVWVATEYIPVVGANFANWGTRIFEVGA
ncbi:MAG: hypothetical protein JO202_09970 [Ktedonobacteraceae bacterium]|nr:hypothetical protein [Ktedonobacteraceae bacterium]